MSRTGQEAPRTSDPSVSFAIPEQSQNVKMDATVGERSAVRRSASERTEGKTPSSLEMRRLPQDVLLGTASTECVSILSEDVKNQGEDEKKVIGRDKDLLHILCLRPGYSLRTQLMLSFGTISAVTITIVVITCVAVAILVGENIKHSSTDAFKDIAENAQTLTARYLAESLSERLLLTNAVNLIHETVLDRFSGYPSGSDDQVPFSDAITGSGRYPLEMSPPPLEWQFETNVNEENYEEHFQGQNYFRNRTASTKSASFMFKGICDPDETDPLADAYFPNCTEANNNITTGGIWEPTDTAEIIYNKGKDVIPLLKALYETRDEIRDLGIGFANSGAGAIFNYPHYEVSTQSSYVSIGCEWMLNPNPYKPSETIGTQEMVDRCTPKGEVVSSRLYSPLERSWCAQQAVNPDAISYSVGFDAWDNGSSLLSMGRPLYDRTTSIFIGCIYVGISLSDIDNGLRNATVVEGEVISVVRWNSEATVIASSDYNWEFQEETAIYNRGLGITEDSFSQFLSLVDFESEWDPADVEMKFSSALFADGTYSVFAYPMPPIPDEYDEKYAPLFMVIVSTPTKSVFKTLDDAIEVVDSRVRDVNIFSIFAGAIGLFVSFVIIFLMAEILTKPLREMNNVASDIVTNFGDPTKEQSIGGVGQEQVSTGARCTPTTELSEVVREFNRMVGSFGGSSMTKTEQYKHHEVYNVFTLHPIFTNLYTSRMDPSFEYSVEPPIEKKTDDESETSSVIVYRHSGGNVMDESDTNTASFKASSDATESSDRSSLLFLWIMLLIVTPLLVVNVVITGVALNTVSSEFSDSLSAAQVFYVNFERAKLLVHSQLRASLVSALTTRATSDLHVLTRYAGWLVFGGLDMPDSYPEAFTAVEDCKEYLDATECPVFEENNICDCSWEDPTSATCQTFPYAARFLQETFWICQSADSDETGNQNSTTFPDHSYSPQTTKWWENAESLPGWNGSSYNGGYATSFDRFRAGTSIPIFQPLYNYHETKGATIGTYFAYERDGLLMGYRGCTNALHIDWKLFESNEANRAFEIRPELCPLGKFGYDARCRGWYDDGKRHALERNAHLLVTAPYEFALVNEKRRYAQSATSPLIDPQTGEYVGQLLLDFVSHNVYTALKQDTPLSENGFPMLITVDTEVDADAVIAPNYSLSDPPTPIATKALPFDFDGCTTDECEENKAGFDAVLRLMKKGQHGSASFVRTSSTGDQEIVHMSYAPVAVRSYRPLNSTDFTRGLETTNLLIYSVALAEPERGMLIGFSGIENATDEAIRIAIGLLCAVLVVATLLVAYISLQVTRSITGPLTYLLSMIRAIRKADNGERIDLRQVKAFQEIVAFADSMEILSVVVQSANSAFHAGDFEVAYVVLSDALRLFRRLDNKKAIGIACNNLGNIMLGMYQTMERDNLKTLAGLTQRQIVTKGIACYHEAIKLGEKAYDEFYNLHGWTPICLDFMQHLSNRYFNRGLFLLSVKDVHEKPDEIEELGMRDLKIAADMDSEVIAYGEEIGWQCSDRIDKIFEVKIVRANGYCLLCELGYDDVWDIETHLMETFDIIKSEYNREKSELFGRIAYPGRMQELETELMKYYRTIGDIETAAKVAIRCLYEDEKVFVDTQSHAMEVLSEYVDRNPDLPCLNRSRVQSVLQVYSQMLEGAAEHLNETKINDLVTKATRVSGNQKKSSPKRWSLHQSCGRFASMEDF